MNKKIFISTVILMSSISPLQLASADNTPAIIENIFIESLPNFNEHYSEAEERYGSLPSSVELGVAKIDWVKYLLVSLGLGESNAAPPAVWGQNIETPEIPLVNREVTMVNYVDGFRKPHIPPMRWTRDGRIGVVGDTGGLDGQSEPLRFRLQKPEKLTEHFVESNPGVHTVDLATWEEGDYSKWGLPGTKVSQHVVFCEPEVNANEQQNPYACGSDGKDDCYDLTLVAAGSQEGFDTSGQVGVEGGDRTLFMSQLQEQDRLYSREVTIKVRDPKTEAARIVAVDISDDYKVAPMRQGVLFEIMTPADGRLFVARRLALPLVWQHSVTGEVKVGNYDTVYAVADDDASPCDVEQWGDLYPISHAPYDPRVKDKYFFAEYPFRDPMGNLIADGDELKGTYPWIDKDAKVLSIMVNSSKLFGGGALGNQPRFDNRCVHDGCTPKDRDGSNDSAYAMLGGWTKGKIVVIDNMLNYSDFRIDLSNALMLDLYKPGSALSYTDNPSHEVEVGASRTLSHSEPNSLIAIKDRDGNPLLDDNGNQQEMLIKNSSSFDTIENRLNYNPNMRPVTPQDIVWTLSSGAATDEFAFDDYLNNNAFIISNMVPAHSVDNDSQYRMTAYDGWRGDFSGEVKVQNSATTLANVWKVPVAGDMVHGRVEPVANGGVKGRGVWFNGVNGTGSTRILYPIPSNQPQAMDSKYWHHSLFVDARGLTDNAERVLINFPDKSRLTMGQSSTQNSVTLNVYNNYGERVHQTLVAKSKINKRWFNIGVQTSPSGRDATIFVNGFPYDEFAMNDDVSALQMHSGSLILGRDHHDYDRRYTSLRNQLLGISTAEDVNYKSFKGWMDEYKVFSYQPDYETACNFANGTLVAVGNNNNYQAIADSYDDSMHQKITQALALRGEITYSRYACYMNNISKGVLAQTNNIESGLVSLRQSMHFPEGPIYHDAPRPDSTTNEFCLACHSTESPKGLSLEALRYESQLNAKDDSRRQPLQAPARITGNLSVEFMDSIAGNWSAYGSELIDEYIRPSQIGVSPSIKNVVSIERQSGRPDSVVNPGDSVSLNIHSDLRANVNGLVNTVTFVVNGVEYSDIQAPFQLPIERLTTSTNNVTINAYLPDGQVASRNQTIYLQ